MKEKIKNCRGCGRLFLSNGSYYCSDCIEKQTEIEQRIIKYVKANPDCTIPDIVNALGINEKIVRKLIEEGRLYQAGVDFYYPCVKCGTPIIAGQYCDKCIKKMKDEIYAEQRKRNIQNSLFYRNTFRK